MESVASKPFKYTFLRTILFLQFFLAVDFLSILSFLIISSNEGSMIMSGTMPPYRYVVNDNKNANMWRIGNGKEYSVRVNRFIFAESLFIHRLYMYVSFRTGAFTIGARHTLPVFDYYFHSQFARLLSNG